MNFRNWFEYKGEHEAPDKDNGAPMHDLSGIYPEDIYSYQAVRLYGNGSPFSGECIAIIQGARGRPNKAIKVYRAIPSILTNQDKIFDAEQQARDILKYGNRRKHNTHGMELPKYYDWLQKEIERLKALPMEPAQRKIGINAGDWVTISRGYAKEHGQSNLNNQYKIISKTVLAKNLYTEGNGVEEWGYIV